MAGIGVLIGISMLAGCGKSLNADTDTVYVQKNGTVLTVDVETLDKDYYDETELKDYVTDAVSAYTEEHGKNTVKLENLLLIGYSPTRVATPYYILTVGLNVLVLLLAIGCVAWVRSYYIEVVQNLFPQLESGSLLPCILTGCLLFFAVSLLNILAIGKKIISIWKGGK